MFKAAAPPIRSVLFIAVWNNAYFLFVAWTRSTRVGTNLPLVRPIACSPCYLLTRYLNREEVEVLILELCTAQCDASFLASCLILFLPMIFITNRGTKRVRLSEFRDITSKLAYISRKMRQSNRPSDLREATVVVNKSQQTAHFRFQEPQDRLKAYQMIPHQLWALILGAGIKIFI